GGALRDQSELQRGGHDAFLNPMQTSRPAADVPPPLLAVPKYRPAPAPAATRPPTRPQNHHLRYTGGSGGRAGSLGVAAATASSRRWGMMRARSGAASVPTRASGPPWASRASSQYSKACGALSASSTAGRVA